MIFFSEDFIHSS